MVKPLFQWIYVRSSLWVYDISHTMMLWMRVFLIILKNKTFTIKQRPLSIWRQGHEIQDRDKDVVDPTLMGFSPKKLGWTAMIMPNSTLSGTKYDFSTRKTPFLGFGNSYFFLIAVQNYMLSISETSFFWILKRISSKAFSISRSTKISLSIPKLAKKK